MDRKQNNAFTIVEMLVAMALAVIVMGLASVIFARAVTAYRKAAATLEITRRADAITQQLTNDFRGLRKDAPLAVWFERDGSGRHYDQILFFANGNFQTIKQYLYDTNGNGGIDFNDKEKTVDGNLSRIYYGHGVEIQTDNTGVNIIGSVNYLQSGLLSRRAHLLTSDTTLFYKTFEIANFNATFLPLGNNVLEYDVSSLIDWQTVVSNQTNCNCIIQTCLKNEVDPSTTGRPTIDMQNRRKTLHLLLSEQVRDFQVQWAYQSVDTNPVQVFEGVRWWPNEAAAFQRGVYFNMPGGTTEAHWGTAANNGFVAGFLPTALKFTFTLYDSKGLFPEGRTFTHIVMIDN